MQKYNSVIKKKDVIFDILINYINVVPCLDKGGKHVGCFLRQVLQIDPKGKVSEAHKKVVAKASATAIIKTIKFIKKNFRHRVGFEARMEPEMI